MRQKLDTDSGTGSDWLSLRWDTSSLPPEPNTLYIIKSKEEEVLWNSCEIINFQNKYCWVSIKSRPHLTFDQLTFYYSLRPSAHVIMGVIRGKGYNPPHCKKKVKIKSILIDKKLNVLYTT